VLSQPRDEGNKAYQAVDYAVSESVNEREPHSPGECEDRDNSHSETRENGPSTEPELGTGENRLPTAGCEDDQKLNLDQILEHYSQHPTIRMKPESTRETYIHHFKRFAKHVGLEEYSRRQLAGTKGKLLILEHVAALPQRSRRPVLSGLASVWKIGVNLPWPIDAKVDVGKLPRVRRDLTPPDPTVKAWFERLLHEPSPYLRCLWLLIAQSGQRPHTVSKLRWSHVRYDENGAPCEIRVIGADEGLKTYADVAWHLPPNVQNALVELRIWLKDSGEGDPILPWMNGWGQIEHSRHATRTLYAGHWERLRARYGLPKLRMKDLRHWVASRCRDARLEEQARAYLQGHEQPINNMGDHYDNRDVETNLARQAQVLPLGPLGIFERAEVDIVETIPPEILMALIGYRDNKVGSPELNGRLEAWRIKTNLEVRADGR